MTAQQSSNSFFNLALIIPFYNEEKRIDSNAFVCFAKQNSDILLILANDCSTDKTSEKIEDIRIQQPENIRIVNLTKNLGKGNTIRQALLSIKDSKIPLVGYIDSDLSTSFESFMALYHEVKEQNIDVTFGSRIKKIDTVIQRTLFRHFSGRIVATIIDTKFKIGCYDSQCGAKLLKKSVFNTVTETPFFTKWLFDVEILLRLRRIKRPLIITEIALNKWEHKKGSKISGLSILTILKELFTLFWKYN